MACKVALYNVIDKLIANKPYISFNKEHGVIDVKNSVTNRINNNNRAAITYSFANQFNKKIKDLIKDKTLGDILYVNWENNVPYILVGPTDRQLNIINNQLSNNTSEVVKKDFEKEKFLRETALRQKRANEYIDDVGDVYPTLQDAIAVSNRKEIENNVNNFITLEEAEQAIKDLYPEITPYFDITGKPNFKEDKDVFNQKEDNVQNQRNENNRIIGQADIKAGTVLIDMLRRKKDTIPHKYAHHYIAWFRNAPIVQEAIKKWGSEEALVQAIGEQAVKQKGEAWDWWTKFKQWIGTLFENLSGKQKEELAQILTDAFLSRADLETGGTLTSERINELRKRASKGIYNQKLEELFESNSEFANTVYEALGFEIPTTKLQGKQFEYGEPRFFDVVEELTSGERASLPSSILINKLLKGEYLPEIKESQIILGLSEAGIWRPNIKKIEASGENKSTLAKKIGHELLHSVTSNIILSYQNLKGTVDFTDKYYKDFIRQGYIKPVDLSKSQIEALDNLVRIRNKVISYVEQNKDKIQKQDRGFGTYDYFIRTNYTESETDLHEFISEVFTNPELINILKEIPTEGKKSKLFKDFVDAIAKILGFTNTSILEDIIAYSEEAFFTQPQITSQQKATAQQLYLQYFEQNPNGSVEQFKNWVEEFNKSKRTPLTPTAEQLKHIKPLSQKLIEQVNNWVGKSNKEILNTLKLYAEVYSKDKDLERLIEVLIDNVDKIKFVKFKGIGKLDNNNNQAEYDGETGEIFVNNIMYQPNNRDVEDRLYRTIIHEYLHGYFLSVLNSPKTEQEKQLVEYINEAYDVLTFEYEGTEKWYGFHNVDEFVSELLSNKEFRESEQVKKTGIIQKILNFINQIFFKKYGKNSIEIKQNTFNKILESISILEPTLVRYASKKGSLSDFISQKSQENNSFQQFQQSLNKPNTNPILQGNQQEQVKKFAELQERLNNKEFLEGAKNAFESSEELQNVYYETLGIEQYSEIELKPYATDVWGKVPKQRGDNNFVNKEQYSIKINTENKGIDVRLTIYFDDSNKTAFVSNIENFENDVTHPLKKGLGLKAFLEANRLITKRGYTPVIDNLVSGYGYDMMLKLEKQGYLSKVLNKNISNSQYDNIKYENPPFVFTNKIYEIQITPQQKQEALNAYTDFIARVSLGILKNPTSGEYNYTSQVKDIVYHGTDTEFDKFAKKFIGTKERGALAYGFTFGGVQSKVYAGNYGKGKKILLSNFLDLKNPLIFNSDSKYSSASFPSFKENSFLIDILKRNGYDVTKWKYFNNSNNGAIPDYINQIITEKTFTNILIKDGYDGIVSKVPNEKYYEYLVFEPEQIHILGSKQDIEGFKDFVQGKPNNVKLGVKELFNENPELANVGTQEQYSQYLDTIFPDSKVKDIVYHGTNLNFDKFDKDRIGSNTAVKGEKPSFSFSNNRKQAEAYSSEITVGQNTNELAEVWFEENQHVFKNGNISTGIIDINNVFDHYKKELEDSKEMISLTGEIDPVTGKYKLIPINDKNLKELSEIKTKEWQQEYNTLLTAGARIMSVILNIKNLKIVDFKGEKKSIKFKEEQKNTIGDAFIAKNIDDWGKGDVIQVFEPEQIHILGSKQDIEGFKEFVNRQNNTTPLVNVNIDLENKPITKNDIINSDVFHELITQMVSNNEINKNCK